MAPLASADQLARAMAAGNRILGRLQGPEQIHSQTLDLAASSQVQLPRTIGLARPLESIVIELRGRIAVSAANYADVGIESIPNLLQMVQVQGQHQTFGNLTPIRMTGATAFVWPRLFQATGNDLIVNGTRIADPGRPFQAAPGAALTTAGSPYDFICTWRIPLVPMLGPGQSQKRQAVQYYYQPRDWQDSLQLIMSFGDKSALGDPTGATVAMTSFGAGTGLPQLSVHLNYALLGEYAGVIPSRIIQRVEQGLSGFTGLATQTRLAQLAKQTTLNIVVKSGLIETTAQAAGVQTFDTLSDTILDRTQVQADNKPVRNNGNNMVQKSYYGQQFGTVIPQGYLLLSFVEGQNAELGYAGRNMPGGSQFELFTDVVTASADTRLSYVQETVLDSRR